VKSYSPRSLHSGLACQPTPSDRWPSNLAPSHVTVATIELFHWNPRTPLRSGRVSGRLLLGRRVNNFGDLLGPLIVNGIRARLGLSHGRPTRSTRLFSVGSVLHYATARDTVWGSGVNGHWLSAQYCPQLDIRALRGPLTRRFLLERGTIDIPEVYGDPALLLPIVRPDLLGAPRTIPITVVANINEPNDLGPPHPRSGVFVLDPRSPLDSCLRTIAASQLVVGTSLHAIVVAEALGIGARVIRSRGEGAFKYLDYYRGTGRDFSPAESLEQAIAMGADEPPQWDSSRLLAAFPRDLWTTSERLACDPKHHG
jgi:pyruvyltransferase